mmetsp:Transcript_138925/g.241581  ORF Transcript_138925/g.241581 Transcript_138925/m.241581 type:complete len:84 (+) Transcript_138925:191-442(+)
MNQSDVSLSLSLASVPSPQGRICPGKNSPGDASLGQIRLWQTGDVALVRMGTSTDFILIWLILGESTTVPGLPGLGPCLLHFT